MTDGTRSRRHSLARDAVLVLAVDGACALIIAALHGPMASGRLPTWIVRGLIITMVYAASGWTLAQLTMPTLGPLYARRRFLSRWLLLIASLLLIGVAGCCLAVYILVALDIFPAGHYWGLVSYGLGFASLITFIVGVSKYAYENMRGKLETMTRSLHLKELEGERARKLAVEARLSSLESRVHPHFLFNTLNSISSLIQEDPARAERMVERLAALLRFSLDSNRRSLVPLRQEIYIVTDYLEIERARLGERLRYSIDLPAELEPIGVPPLAVLTLVENSIKYAVSPSRAGGAIHIRARAWADRASIEVSDDGPGFTELDLDAGHGLDNLKSRLAVLFNNEAALDISKRATLTTVTVTVPMGRAIIAAAV